MRVTNYNYDDLVLRYSQTARALNSGKFDNSLAVAENSRMVDVLPDEISGAVNFDKVLASVESSREIDSVIAEAAKFYAQRGNSGKDEILTFVAKKTDGPDTLLIEAANAYSQAQNVYGRFDSVLRGDA